MHSGDEMSGNVTGVVDVRRAADGGPYVSPGPVRTRPSATALPVRPPTFVAREADLAAVRRLLVDPAGGTVVGIVGTAGAGKSTLARALVHDTPLRSVFADGIVWADLRPDPDVAVVLGAVLAGFGDPRPVTDVTEGAARLRSLLTGARCLIVLDNLGQVGVPRAFPVPAGNRLLVTTRAQETLPDDSIRHDLAPVEPANARKILATHAGWRERHRLPGAAVPLLERCGGLPLALALAGSLVRTNRDWTEVANALAVQPDLARLAAQLDDGRRHVDLLAVLDASVRLLPAEEATRFRELAVFHGRGPVPTAAVARLWAATGAVRARRTKRLLRQFAALSLIELDQYGADTVTMHDLLADYARLTLPTGRIETLHDELAASFLASWGGLEQRLPALRDGSGLGADHGYGITRLVGHLLAANRVDLVDTLYATEWAGGPERAAKPRRTGNAATGNRANTGDIASAGDLWAENLWYVAHENVGCSGEFLAGVRAAWRDVHTRWPHGGPGAVARQIFYALVVGSVTNPRADIPPELLGRLVDEQVWPPGRAEAYARTVADPQTQAEALTRLLPHLAADQRGPVVRQILTTAAAMVQPYSKARLLAGLGPHLDSAQLDGTLAAASTISDPGARGVALAGIAPYLAADRRRAVTTRALAVAREVGWGPSDVLARLGPLLDATRRAELAARAVADASTGAENSGRPDGQAREVRALELSRILRHLDSGQRGRAVAEVLAVAADIDDPYDLVTTLAGVVGQLEPARRDQVVATALDAAARIEHPAVRAQALNELASGLNGVELRHALALVVRIDSPAERDLARARLNDAPHELDPEPLDPEALGQALAAASLSGRGAVVAVVATVLRSTSTATEKGTAVGHAARQALRQVQRWWP